MLLRGLGLRSARDFEVALAGFEERPRRYIEGQSQRDPVRGDIYTSTAYPAAERIPLHHELSYTADPPPFLAFFCEVAPQEGGATPLLDGRRMLQAMPDTLRRAFDGRGIRYIKTMHGGGLGFGKSWQEHFETDDRDAVSRHLAASGAAFTWLEDGGLRTAQVRPAIAPHPATGEPRWFNQLTLWHISRLGARGQRLTRLLGEDRLPTHATFEDGTPIPDALVDAVRALEWQTSSRFPWEEGDLLMLDNLLVAHGREPFDGPRRVLVAMGGGPALDDPAGGK